MGRFIAIEKFSVFSENPIGNFMDTQTNIEPDAVLREWRTKILNVFLTIVAVAAGVMTIVSIVDAVSRPDQWPAVIVFSLLEDKPGGLYEILGEFARKEINLTKIESRPSKEKLGRYIFFVDFDGYQEDPQIRNILNMIKSKVGYIKILGSYPKEGDD